MFNKTYRLLLIPFLVCLLISPNTLAKPHPKAIEFDSKLPWLNVSRPLTMKDLKGKVVILDFWTYGCINCIHVLEDFRKLKKKYGDKIAIIGIHTPKFDNEKNLETLRRIVVRYGIEHPVVNDIDSIMARQYGMRAWPTQFLIEPKGKILGRVVGEGNYDLFVENIDKLLKEQVADLSTHKLPITLEKKSFAKSMLAAPGKIAVSPDQEMIAISDTLHHRIIITNKQGKVIKYIGGKESGYKNGSAKQARFLTPQGLIFSSNGLYVADTGNHTIRYIDLKTGNVKTVAGNGKNEMHIGKDYKATSIGLRSPWALALQGSQLYIAMAGIHQIWKFDIKEKTIGRWAGSGDESIDDGNLNQAGFSQPSGLSIINNKLYVADSEDSAVRVIDLKEKQVKTLVGSGLFDFGDKDGSFKKARLQHVLGVATKDPNFIYITDTYNHKLKLLNLKTKTISTVAGTGKPGKGAGKATKSALNEPGGLVFLGDNILISDTNNNRIMQYNPIKKTLSEWKVYK